MATIASVGQTKLFGTAVGGGRATKWDNGAVHTTASHVMMRSAKPTDTTKINYFKGFQKHDKRCITPMAANPAVGVTSVGAKTWDDGTFAGVKAIVLYASQGINSVQFEYVNEFGESHWGKTHGNPDGIRYDISLDYCQGERLATLVRYEDDCVECLIFQSNTRTFGPYGTKKGTYSKFEGNFLGFYGTANVALESITPHLG